MNPINPHKRLIMRSAGVLILAMAGAAGNALAAVNEPYQVKVSYDPTGPRASVTFGADGPAAYGYGIERRPVGRTTWNQVGYINEPLRSYLDATVAPLTRYEYRVKAYRPGGPSSGYISTSTATIALNFPYYTAYPNGIAPSNFTREQQAADARAMYGYWRAKYTTTTGAGTGGMRVYKSDENGETVSEGQGYGMVISVYMADSGNNAKSDFDMMLTYYKSKHKVASDGSNTGLMAWRVNADGSIADNWVAPDGDMDAAWALLVADRKWGSGNGNPNYWGEAQNILNGLQKWATYNHSTTSSDLIANADKELSAQEGAGNYTMSSYQMVGYMSEFANASDTTRAAQWHDTLKAGYKAYDYFYDTHSSTALTPFTFLTMPGATQYQQGSKGYSFGPDSCRVPWRVGMDYLWHGNAHSAWVAGQIPSVRSTLAHDMPMVNAAWFKNATGGRPQTAWYHYELDGTPTVGTTHWGQRHTAGAMAVGAMTDTSNQSWLNDLYSYMRVQIPGQPYTSDGITLTPEYYADTVLMVTMIAVTGNMPNLPNVAIPAQ